jgi:hypothetical protein
MADYLMLLESLLHFNWHGIVVAYRTTATCEELETLRGAPISLTWTAIARLIVSQDGSMKLKSQRHCIVHGPHCN